MKLVMCRGCGDIFNLVMDREKTCSCGQSSGVYVDRRHAEIKGNCYSLAIGNGSMEDAIYNLAVYGRGYDREFYIDRLAVKCWLRPNQGPGNPHTTWEDPNA